MDHYTRTPKEKNCLDLVEYVSISMYNQAFCSQCKKIIRFKAEGCEGLIIFTCSRCGAVIVEFYRTKY